MNLPLTQEQLMIRDMIREFARSEIEPVAQEYNRKGNIRRRSSRSWESWAFTG